MDCTISYVNIQTDLQNSQVMLGLFYLHIKLQNPQLWKENNFDVEAMFALNCFEKFPDFLVSNVVNKKINAWWIESLAEKTIVLENLLCVAALSLLLNGVKILVLSKTSELIVMPSQMMQWPCYISSIIAKSENKIIRCIWYPNDNAAYASISNQLKY